MQHLLLPFEKAQNYSPALKEGEKNQNSNDTYKL